MAARFSGASFRTYSSSCLASCSRPDLDLGAAQRDVGGEIGRMTDKAGLAGVNRLVESFGATVLLGERREGNGRRVRLDPAFQFFDARRVRHG